MNLFKSSPFKISCLIFLFILSLCPSVFAGAPDTLWTRTYGGSDIEDGSSVQQTADGGFIIAGTTRSIVEGSADVYLIRTDSNGDTLWTKTYGGYYEDWGFSVIQTRDNGFFITGSTYGIDSVNNDVYLIRTDSNGDTLWTKMYGGADLDDGFAAMQTSDSGFIIVGMTWPLGTDGLDVYLVRINQLGDTLWTRNYGGTSNEIGYSVQQTTDGGFIITGSTRSFGAGSRDVYLIRTNPNGDTLWTKTYGGIDNDEGFSVLQTGDGGFIVAGSTSSVGAGMSEVYLVRINQLGDTLWTRNYGGTSNDFGYSVQQTTDGGFIIAGVTESFGAGKGDFYFIKTDYKGDTLWTKTYGGTGEDWCSSISPTSDGGFIAVGATNSFGDTLSDVYLIRLDKDSTGIQEDNQKNILNQNNFVVTGDFRNNILSIRYTIHHSGPVKLSMYNISGQLVKTVFNEHKSRGEYSEQIKTDKISSGVYYVTLEAGESRYTRKSVVVE